MNTIYDRKENICTRKPSRRLFRDASLLRAAAIEIQTFVQMSMLTDEQLCHGICLSELAESRMIAAFTGSGVKHLRLSDVAAQNSVILLHHENLHRLRHF